MNRFGSHPNHENQTIYEGFRLRASPRHGGQRVFFEFLVADPPLGRPVGGGGNHRN